VRGVVRGVVRGFSTIPNRSARAIGKCHDKWRWNHHNNRLG
jgi:hypothetical protein